MAETEEPAPARRRARPRTGGRTARAPDEPAHGIIDDLGTIARDKAHTLRGEVDDLIAARQRVAADGLDDLSQALHQASTLLSDRGRTALADLGHAGADRVDEAAAAVRERDLSTLLADAYRLIRRDPVLLATSAVGLGFLLTRMLRSARTE